MGTRASDIDVEAELAEFEAQERAKLGLETEAKRH